MKLSDLKEYNYDAYKLALINIHIQDGFDYLTESIQEDKNVGQCFYFSESNEGKHYWQQIIKSYERLQCEKVKPKKKTVISLDQWESNILNVALDHMADHLRDVVSDKDDSHEDDVEDYRDRLIWVEDMIKLLSK